MDSSKRKAFSTDYKVSIVRKIENGFDQADICKDNKLSKCTIGTMCIN